MTVGASPVLATSKNNRRRFDEILNEKVSPGPLSFLGYENATTSAVFFGILNAANLLPTNSGLVVFVKGEIEDEELTPHARALVARKRIQVSYELANPGHGTNNTHDLRTISRSS